MSNKKVYIVVLNWNGTEDTIACLSSLKQITYNNFQIILVDNGSKKESFLKLFQWSINNFLNIIEYNRIKAESGGDLIAEKEKLSNISSENLIIINNGDNLGFAVGNNVALKYILTKQKSDSLTLLLNNDTEVKPDFLNNLVSFMHQNKQYVAVTPQIRWYEPNTKIWNCGGRITWFGNRRYYFAGKHINLIKLKKTFDITFITGCALMFKPQITGILSEQFFFGEEDFEFSMRMKKQKQKMACISDSIVYHKVGKSIKFKEASNKLNRIFLFYSSRFINQKNFYPYLFRIFIKLINIVRLLIYIQVTINISIQRNLFYLIGLWKYSEEKNEILKQDFDEIMNMKF
ncbi:glycosyltransferase [Saccharicrinis sp. FJH62]|uniref:glycosyltransferase n=1 Tax=Saccharicrinis sp. FJH62 TaxID=3344657 RepID=UPI0035D5038C